jgi:hypothetical protein
MRINEIMHMNILAHKISAIPVVVSHFYLTLQNDLNGKSPYFKGQA